VLVCVCGMLRCLIHAESRLAWCGTNAAPVLGTVVAFKACNMDGLVWLNAVCMAEWLCICVSLHQSVGFECLEGPSSWVSAGWLHGLQKSSCQQMLRCCLSYWLVYWLVLGWTKLWAGFTGCVVLLCVSSHSCVLAYRLVCLCVSW